VLGGKGHELVVGIAGVDAGAAGQAHHGVAVDAGQPFGLADAAALVQVRQDGVGLLGRQPAVKQGGALALGEASPNEL